jgi:hypothetical protein
MTFDIFAMRGSFGDYDEGCSREEEEVDISIGDQASLRL